MVIAEGANAASGGSAVHAHRPTRVAWPDYAKGLAILLIVGCHVAGGLRSAGLGEFTPTWAAVRLVCYAFMVPVFFFISGWFAECSRRPLAQRSTRVLSHLVYPYVVWSTVQTVLMIVTQAGNRSPTWADLPGILVGGWMQFWFLHALILISLLDLAFRYAGVSPAKRMTIAALVSLLGMVGFQFGVGALFKAATHLVYFEAGVFCARTGLPALRTSSQAVAASIAAFALVGLHLGGAGYGTQLRPLAALCGIAACLAVSSWLPSPARGWGLRFFAACGYYSLEIYILHVVVAATTRQGLVALNVEAFSIQLVLGLAVGVGVPLIVASRVEGRWAEVLFRFTSERRTT